MAKLNTGSVSVVGLTDGREVLQSYGTTVAAYVPGVGYVRTDERFSTTTSKHINIWLDGCEARQVPHAELLKLTAPVRSKQ